MTPAVCRQCGIDHAARRAERLAAALKAAQLSKGVKS